MNFFSFLGSAAGAGAGEAVKGVLTGVGQLAKDIRGVVTGELPPEARAKLEEIALQAEVAASQAQTAVNAVEAAHPSVFVAGWRPFIGWVCGIGIGYAFVVRDILAWSLRVVIKLQGLPDIEPPPYIGTGELMTLVSGMLGVAGMRTYEKFKGAEKNR